MLSSFLSAKAAAAAVLAFGLAGAGTAAYTGSLPGSLQQFAHQTIGAPAAHPTPDPSSSDTPVGPDATGPAAYGLCTAYMHATKHGQAAPHSVAFRNLEAAAGGAANVAAYCATVTHPGNTAAPDASPAPSHSTGRPTSPPTGPPTSHPTSRPTVAPTSQG